MPETAFDRAHASRAVTVETKNVEDSTRTEKLAETDVDATHLAISTPKKSWTQTLHVFGPTLTNEPFWIFALPPVLMLALPSVLWATIALGLGVGIFVVLSVTVASAYTEIYGFSTYQVGLICIAVIVGNLFGIPFGGWVSDHISNFFTKRNKGIKIDKAPTELMLNFCSRCP
jgi:ABC-type proline/glycine betaine transport system permease subunit